jgi:Domain of unknown function (DUF4331)
MCSAPRSRTPTAPRSQLSNASPLASIVLVAVFVAALTRTYPCFASDHLDTPTVIANPSADIADVYAWMAPKGRQLNLVMTIVGHSFSDKIHYIFHIDSGRSFGKTTATTSIMCHFPSGNVADCRVGDADSAHGDASKPEGLQGTRRRFRVFAGLRDDPFFNNVKGTRAAYKRVAAALASGAPLDGAGCPTLDPSVVHAIHEEWRHTDGGPATNFLAGWTPASIVISVDLDAVSQGGPMLAVWGSTSVGAKQLDREGRPMMANALLGLLAPDDVSDGLKEQFNATTPADAKRFITEIQKGLALYDSFDGKCGNQLLADHAAAPAARYRALATLLADDRLWINGSSSVCTQLFAVELASLTGQSALSGDCGGRTPNYDAANVFRSLLVDGTNVSMNDGLHADERQHSASDFPFLAPPDQASAAIPARQSTTGDY